METYVGLSGVIETHPGMGIMIKRIQSDVNTYDADGVWVAVSGSLGTFEYTFNAINPVETDLKFAPDENVDIYYDDGGTAGELTNLVISYNYYGDQIAYMQLDPSRGHWTPTDNQWSRGS